MITYSPYPLFRPKLMVLAGSPNPYLFWACVWCHQHECIDISLQRRAFVQDVWPKIFCLLYFKNLHFPSVLLLGVISIWFRFKKAAHFISLVVIYFKVIVMVHWFPVIFLLRSPRANEIKVSKQNKPSLQNIIEHQGKPTKIYKKIFKPQLSIVFCLLRMLEIPEQQTHDNSVRNCANRRWLKTRVSNKSPKNSFLNVKVKYVRS